MKRLFDLGQFPIGCAALIAMLVLSRLAQAQGFEVLYSFPGGNSGAYPTGAPLQDKAGNLYGVTAGTYVGQNVQGSVLFKLEPDGTESVLYSFQGGSDGDTPAAGVIADKAGSFYGVTIYGGQYGCGVAYKVTPAGSETVLRDFDPATDGCQPFAGLTIDGKGNLYGTTSSAGPIGGTVFELKPSGREKILHSFPTGANDGWQPAGNLLRDSFGNLYGTTVDGGINCGGSGCGTVFKIAPDGTETVLYAFKGPPDGAHSYSNIVADKAGNLYGTTFDGGGTDCKCGTIFKVTPAGVGTTLYSFCGCLDGGLPSGNVVLDKEGNLYGTTLTDGQFFSGTVWKLKPDGHFVVLYSLNSSGNSGDSPVGVIIGSNGNLFGQGSGAGQFGYGTVFSLPR